MKDEYKQTWLIIALFTKKFQKMGKNFQNEIQAKERKEERKKRKKEEKGREKYLYISLKFESNLSI